MVSSIGCLLRPQATVDGIREVWSAARTLVTQRADAWPVAGASTRPRVVVVLPLPGRRPTRRWYSLYLKAHDEFYWFGGLAARPLREQAARH